MLFVDALFRFSGVALLAMLAALVWRDHRGWKSSPYLILSCISVAALFIGYLPDALEPPQPIYLAARFLDIPHLVFVWLFALSLFDSAFRLSVLYFWVGVLYAAPILWLRLGLVAPVPDRPDWLILYGSVTSALLMLHLCFVTLRGRADDMLEQRRASRVYFVVMITFVAVAAAITDLLPQDLGAIDKRTTKILPIWIAIVWGAIWMLRFDRAAVSFGLKSGSGRSLSVQETGLKTRVIEEMSGREAFREPGLTIGSLASRLGVSESRLRGLINEGLGYPNFSTFVNDYRIEAVKRAFQSPESAHLPILTIAMDAGFKSLSPFNKAFRQKEAVTPSEFRKTLGAPKKS